MGDKDLYIYKSKLAEQAERYDDMVEWMHKVALAEPEMNVEERNLLSVAYKNVIGSKRTSWRIVTTLEQKEEEKVKSKGEADDDNQLSFIRSYKQEIEAELRTTCLQVLELLDNILTAPKTIDGNPESKVFYYKMKGDYFRYMAEISSKQGKEDPAQESLKAYKEASDIGQALDSTHPIRLGLALNFSVFFYEILGDPSRACKVAKAAFDDAIKDLDKLPEENYKDATLIMQLLRDNLTLWTSDMERKDEAEDQEQVQDIE